MALPDNTNKRKNRNTDIHVPINTTPYLMDSADHNKEKYRNTKGEIHVYRNTRPYAPDVQSRS